MLAYHGKKGQMANKYKLGLLLPEWGFVAPANIKDFLKLQIRQKQHVFPSISESTNQSIISIKSFGFSPISSLTLLYGAEFFRYRKITAHIKITLQSVLLNGHSL